MIEPKYWHGTGQASLFILYCYDKQLDYYDVFRCRNSWLLPYQGPSDSYMMVPGTGESCNAH